jgi:transposase-like protein
MLNLVTAIPSVRPEDVRLTLDEIAREGARRMLMEALQAEVSDYIDKFKDVRDESGKRLVVRHGKAEPRRLTLGAGTVALQAPRVKDRRPGEKFSSKILPAYLRKSPKVENLLPILYLKGLSSSDFRSALTEFFGEGTLGLSASAIVALKRSWEADFKAWKKKRITDRYVYVFADGVHVSVRLGEDKRLCLLVLIGVTENGEKHLLAVEPGYRESKESWAGVLRDLRGRGLEAPILAVGDGALGFWSALRETAGFERTREQRCWIHKMGNVLNELPKRVQPRAKGLLREIMYADTLTDATLAKKKLIAEFDQKYPKATAKIEKDWTELTAFFALPAVHWTHLRTTNPIESTFSTVRLRTNVTRGAGSPVAAATMAFKLLQDAEKTWNRIRGYDEIKNVLSGVEYVNGVMVPRASSTHQEAPAA